MSSNKSRRGITIVLKQIRLQEDSPNVERNRLEGRLARGNGADHIAGDDLLLAPRAPVAVSRGFCPA